MEAVRTVLWQLGWEQDSLGGDLNTVPCVTRVPSTAQSPPKKKHEGTPLVLRAREHGQLHYGAFSVARPKMLEP